MSEMTWGSHPLSVEQLGADTLSSLTHPGTCSDLPTRRGLAPAELKEICFLPTVLFSLSPQFGLLINFSAAGLEDCRSILASPSLPLPGSVKFTARLLWASPWRHTPASLPPWMKCYWYFYISEQAAAHTSFSSPAHFLPALLLSLL